MTPVVLSWSGGKDCTLALETLHADQRFEVVALLCTLTRGPDRISMHGVREALLDQQARSLDVPLRKVWLPEEPDNAAYEAAMTRALESIRNKGVDTIAFGDLYLADVRAYREQQMAKADMQPLFPIWHEPTDKMARRFVSSGYRAILTCVDTQAISEDFAGRDYDRSLLDDLPENCDPCGENGEFHTFVYDGPLFDAPLPIKTGQKVLRDTRFQFCDVLSADRER